ncbi:MULTISPECIES: AraC family transcriptional regulator [unclassified Rhodococcus (in: high G+C Gram-positive bacteria)]|uniref:AraC family transcriptional regulator n=1 Tax=unclassified Rhodococcus (in: high G+C Gram-positive bacteria) TaxID=192944 RepID=UPI001639AAC4|nr:MULTISPECIES: AraC family transcriptional regulator [unclassified Rhodococcus (in: high G+C Gram-positive bacteria)]MBC2641863.1 AraC family transcriptional regulator [Rhodococcus sp. 3A]MBC2893394.1 AraC family transcriptional regulator [Rhodococcus sp. 4CII]
MQESPRGTDDTASEPDAREVRAFEATDPDRAEDALGHTYFPHRLHQLGTGAHMDMSLHLVELGPLTVGRLTYGAAEVSLDLGELGNAYNVAIPLAGRHETESAGQTHIFAPGQACIYMPHRSTRITRWSADGVQYGIKFDRDYLESELQAILGWPTHVPVTFDPVLDLSNPKVSSWLALVKTLVADLDKDHSMLYSPLVSPPLVEALTRGLLLTADHDRRELLEAGVPGARPRTVKAAVDAMYAHPEESWTVRTLAELAGVSVRTLQDGFARYVGATPMAYLRGIRLERAHDDLLAADPGFDSVSDIAYRWGFRHLGRFSVEYRKRYGQPPSVTLSKA